MLLLALVILAVVSSISAVAVVTAVLGQKVVRNDFYRETAYRIAESGIEKAIVEIVGDAQFTGENDVAFDLGSFSTTVQATGEHEREIISVGQTPKGDFTVFRHRIVARVTLEPDHARIVSWSESTLPIHRIKRKD